MDGNFTCNWNTYILRIGPKYFFECICQNIPSLVTVAMSDKPWHTHTTHHVQTEHARAGYFWYETRSQLSDVAIF